MYSDYRKPIQKNYKTFKTFFFFLQKKWCVKLSIYMYAVSLVCAITQLSLQPVAQIEQSERACAEMKLAAQLRNSTKSIVYPYPLHN